MKVLIWIPFVVTVKRECQQTMTNGIISVQRGQTAMVRGNFTRMGSWQKKELAWREHTPSGVVVPWRWDKNKTNWEEDLTKNSLSRVCWQMSMSGLMCCRHLRSKRCQDAAWKAREMCTIGLFSALPSKATLALRHLPLVPALSEAFLSHFPNLNGR